MKRDMDLIRKIAFAVESMPSSIDSESLRIDGFNEEQIAYHCELMNESGLFVAIDTQTMHSDYASFNILRLTSKGHDFVDAARSDSVWNKAKATIATTVGSVSLDMMIRYLKTIAGSALGLPPDP
jgi:hypothetical protein